MRLGTDPDRESCGDPRGEAVYRVSNELCFRRMDLSQTVTRARRLPLALSRPPVAECVTGANRQGYEGDEEKAHQQQSSVTSHQPV
jgi:hypothetical protein